MSNIVDSGFLKFVFLLLMVMVPLLFLLAWFFVNRISVRANEQIELLEALLEQQKQQTALLRRLCVVNDYEDASEMADEDNFLADEFTEDDPLIQLVAER